MLARSSFFNPILNAAIAASFCAVFPLFFTPTAPASAEGGTSSNGGGGSYTKNFSWRTFGPSTLDNAESFSADRQMEELIKGHSTELTTSCSNGRRILAAPASLRAKIVIEAAQPRSFWQWLKRESPKISHFTLQQLCDNDQLFNAYTNLMDALYVTSESDRVGRELIQKSFEKSGVIHFQLEESEQNFKARGGSLTENTWFNHETGVIHWGPFKARKGLLELVLQRKPIAFLRHELTHVLLLRSLGSRYPKETIWHDVRFQTEEKQVRDHYEKLSTSESAAYIEGIAGVFEAGKTFAHPYIVDVSSFSGFSYFSERDQYCLWHPQVITRDRNGQITAPLKSEAYVGSALMELFRERHADVKDKLDSAGSIGSINEARMIDLIQVIATVSPTSIEELVKGYENLKKDQLATRWYREYFFKDLETGQTLEGDLETIELKPNPFIHLSKTYCYTRNSENLLTPLKDAQSNAELQAEVARRNQALKDKVEADVKEVLRVEKGMIDETTQHTVSLESADAKQKSLSLRVSHQCQKNRDGELDLDHSMIEIHVLYDKIQTQYPYARRGLSWVGIFKSLKNGCDESKRIQAKYQELIRLSEQAQALATSSDDDRVSQWIQLRNKIRAVSDDILITQALVAVFQ